MSNGPTSPPDKYVVVLAPDQLSKGDLQRTQSAMGQKLTSSQELGGGVRAQDVYASGSGIVFKNLGVAVVEQPDLKQLAKAEGVLHVEREETFRPVGTARGTISELRATLEILSGQLTQLEDRLEEASATPTDEDNTNTEKEAHTWGLSAIGATTGSRRGKGIKICVADTGLDTSHPDFNGRAISGKSFIAGQPWDRDINGHGTHCTGVVAGDRSRENGIRYGAAPDADLMIAKVLADDGNGTTSSIIDGIDWALEKGARIVSLSFGAPTAIGAAPSQIFEAVGERAMAMGCLIVAAAGNFSKRPGELPRPVASPANALSILSVAALDRKLRVANFSNAGLNAGNGGRVDLAAPGVDIYSCFSRSGGNTRDYLSMDGTSMAAPYVSAVAALYLELFPHLTPGELWLKMEKQARAIEGQQLRDVGAGLVRVPVG